MIAQQDLLRNAARSNPDGLAVVDPERGVRYRFETLDARVSAVARGLLESGVQPGDRVGVLGEIDPDIAIITYACGRVGATIVPVDPTIGIDRIQRRFEQVSVDSIVTTESADSSELRTHLVDDLAAIGAKSDRSIHATVQPSDIACIMFTSGTTGTPAAVPLNWDNLVSSAIGSAFRLGVDPSDRWIVCLQPYHMGGFAPLIRSVLYGTGMIFCPPTPEVIEVGIRELAGTGISLVPPLLERLLDAEISLDELRVILVGGDRTSPAMIERALALDLPIHCSYGMTEAASQIATATPRDLRDAPETVGRPLRWVRLDILDANGDEVVPGSTGEIVVRGPTVTGGYLNEQGHTRFTEDGGLRTGDEGYIDESGRLVVTGRLADRIVTGGETINPHAVAEILTGHPAIRAAAVVGLPDDRWGERVGALLETTEEVDGSEIVASVADAFSGGEQPRTVATTEALPRTESGTVHRPTVRRILKDQD